MSAQSTSTLNSDIGWMLAPSRRSGAASPRIQSGSSGLPTRRYGAPASRARICCLVVLIHALAIAGCLASRSEAALGIANRASESLMISLIPHRETAEPPTARQAPRSEPRKQARSEMRAQPPDKAPAPLRSEAAAVETPTVAAPPAVAAQAEAAHQVPPAHVTPVSPLAQQAPREIAQLSCEVPEPEYPQRSKRRGESGRVVMRIAIDERGVVSQTRLVRSSAYPALDQAAQRAAQQARCAPYIENGKALAVSALQSFKFEWAD